MTGNFFQRDFTTLPNESSLSGVVKNRLNHCGNGDTRVELGEVLSISDKAEPGNSAKNVIATFEK